MGARTPVEAGVRVHSQFRVRAPLGELTRSDCHRAWALHEVPDHGDSVDARDNDDDAFDNARRN